MVDIAAKAEIVDTAAKNATAIPQFSETGESLTLSEAYQIQEASVQRRLDRGEQLVGVKMGFTSKAKMIQMGVDDLIWGRLTDAMKLDNGGSLNIENYVHPRIEPEIAFLLKAPLAGEVSIEEAKAAVESVAPAMEVIDSRYENFKFSLEDVVADNSSSSSFVIGDWQAADLDISDIAMAIEFDGEEVLSGSSAAILGDPWLSLVDAARLAGAAGLELQPGWVVLAGAATAAEALKLGITARVVTRELGCAEVSVEA